MAGVVMVRHAWERNRWRLVGLVVLTVIGLYSKFYVGWGQDWVNDSLGGVFYVIFWWGVGDLFQPRVGVKTISGGVFGLTCGLEFLQLVRHPILDWARSSFVGRTILGTTYAVSDFFYYAIGGILGYFWVLAMRRVEAVASKEG